MKALAQLIGPSVARWAVAVFGFDVAHKVFANEKWARAAGWALVGLALAWSCLEKFFQWRARERAKPVHAQTATTTGGVIKHPLIFLLGGAIACQGCLGPLQGARERIADRANEAAYQATRARLIERRHEVGAFTAVQVRLSGLMEKRDYEPAHFASALRELPVHELRGDGASILVAHKVVVWDADGGHLTKAADPKRTKSILGGVYLGIARAVREFTEPIHP